ncbi:MAG: DNA internalization-related competence protein ComEC/Rec2 [Bacilli bacterium]|nr:DNA internalization-related competence protein ComEC/Rec2 [Bacilli bacterium]
MLKLRKILLSDILYYVVLIFTLIILIPRLTIPKTSNYHSNSNYFQGKITDISYIDEKLTIKLKNKETIIASTYLKNKNFDLNLGDELLIKGNFKTPASNTTDYLFNYQTYLSHKNTFYLVEIISLKRISENKNLYYFIKQKLINHLEGDPYLHTFILGDKKFLRKDVKRSYQGNGISHLFAISGMHITLLSSLLEKILKRFKLSEESIFKIVTLILLLYLFLVGLAPSILRGVLFYIVFSLNKIYYFYIKPINLFILILSTSLLINPNYLYDIGFQYSYLISFSLIISSKYLSSEKYLISLFKVSLLSLITSLPITLYNFHELNFLSLIYNLFYVPLISLLIFPLALLTVIFKPITPIFNLLTTFLEKSSLLLNRISIGKFIFKRVSNYIYLLYLLLVIIYLIKRRKQILFIILTLLIIHYSLPFFDTSNYLKMLDIGQGDSILIHSHNKNILIDTGGVTNYGSQNTDGEIYHNTISPCFKSLGISKLDYLILTHGDKDHLGEANTIIENIPVNKIIINSNKINYYEKSLIKENTIIGKQNLSFKVNDLIFTQLNENLDDENDSSQIYLLNYNNLKILLTGDASIKSEEKLLENYELGHIDILKVGHHGSKTSTSEKLLETLKPKVALISSGRENKFNHPHQEIIKRLKKYNLKIYNTQDSGTVTVDLDRKVISETKNSHKK